MPETQKESCPTGPPSTAPQSLTLRTDALRKESHATCRHTCRHCRMQALQKPALQAGSETPEQQQGSCPTKPPSTAPQSLTLRTDALKKQSLCPTSPHQPTYQKTSFESPLQNTSPYQKPALRVHCRTSSAGRFRNTRTAARIVPNKTSQHGAPNL